MPIVLSTSLKVNCEMPKNIQIMIKDPNYIRRELIHLKNKDFHEFYVQPYNNDNIAFYSFNSMKFEFKLEYPHEFKIVGEDYYRKVTFTDSSDFLTVTSFTSELKNGKKFEKMVDNLKAYVSNQVSLE
jgi:hypothetical protein